MMIQCLTYLTVFLFFFHINTFSQNIEFSTNLNCKSTNDIQIYPFTKMYTKSLKCIDGYNEPILATKNKKNIRVINAADYIYKCIDTVQMICFNEYHHNPSSRIFLYSILDSLYKKGFRDIAMEGIDKNKINDINSRNYLLYSDSYYLEEVFFYKLIKKIKALNMTIHSYDKKINWNYFIYDENGDVIEKRDTINDFYSITTYKDRKAIELKVNYIEKREQIGAFNIANNILPKVKDKLILFAGLGHIYEKWQTSLITELKNITSINPLTFDLTVMTEHSEMIFEDTIYKNLQLEVPSIISINNSFYNYSNMTDYCIATPRYIKNDLLSDILIAQGRNKYTIPLQFINKENGYPVICSVFNKSDSIPIESIELLNYHSDRTLYIPKGNFNLKFRYINGLKETVNINY